MGEGRRLLWTAWLASLGVHLGLLLLTWNADLLRPAALAGAPSSPPPVELVLTPAQEAEPEKPQAPTAYTDVPERHAVETPPDDPQYLAMVNSRASDPLPGGEDKARPGAPQAAEIEQVGIHRESLAESGGMTYAGRQDEASAGPDAASGGGQRQQAPAAAEPRRQPAAADDFPLTRAEPGPERNGGRPQARPERNERLPDLVGGSPSILRPGPLNPSGDPGFDFDQPALGRDGNAMLETPDFRLSTWEWNWAPWMKAFGNDLRRHWFAPYAYALGVIDGRTVLRLVVQPNGSVSEVEVLKKEGHESLHQASLNAVHAAAPFAPLPPDFPDPQLEIILTLYYPAWKAPPAAESPAEEAGRGRGRGGRRGGR